MSLHCEFIINLFADGGFKHKANLKLIDLDDLTNDFIREVMNDYLLFIFPDNDPSFLKAYAHEFTFFC